MTMPGAFHCGFNSGFNMAEAANFALASWIPRGLAAKPCLCRPGAVTIDMRVFTSPASTYLTSPAPSASRLPHACAHLGSLERQHEAQGLAAYGRGGGAGRVTWKEDDVVWALVPESPAWPCSVCRPCTARQKKELAEKPGWLFVVFYGPCEEWAVVPPCDVVCRFPGPEEVARGARAMASKQVRVQAPLLLLLLLLRLSMRT